MSAEQSKTTITVEAVDKIKLPSELRGNLDDRIVTVRNGENTLTLLRPNAHMQEGLVHVHQDGLTAAKLPAEVLTSEVPFDQLDSNAQRTVTYWVLRMYGHQLGYEMFPDLE
jgi:hypothetical protein